MEDLWLSLSGPLALRRAAEEIEACNAETERFGLVLTKEQAVALVQTRRDALKSSGRLELGGGALPALIHAFCDSPYLNRENYAETMHTLTELFYTYKSEMLDAVDDDELLEEMRDAFNGPCKGSAELMEGWVLEELARRIRFSGLQADGGEEEQDGEDGE